MKKVLLLLAVIATVAFTSSCSRIDTASEGMIVNMYGDSKGVESVSVATGWTWYWPFSQEIVTYPNYIKTVDYPVFYVNAKDGTKIPIDAAINIRLIPGSGPMVLVKYRKSIDEIINGPLRTIVVKTYRTELNKFDTQTILSNREKFDINVEKSLRAKLEESGFELCQFANGIKTPKCIEVAINRKIEAEQRAQQAQKELEVTRAQTKKQILQARADSTIMVVNAKAEALANKLKSKEITSKTLDQLWIEKWDGKLPVYGTVPNMVTLTNK